MQVIDIDLVNLQSFERRLNLISDIFLCVAPWLSGQRFRVDGEPLAGLNSTKSGLGCSWCTGRVRASGINMLVAAIVESVQVCIYFFRRVIPNGFVDASVSNLEANCQSKIIGILAVRRKYIASSNDDVQGCFGGHLESNGRRLVIKEACVLLYQVENLTA